MRSKWRKRSMKLLTVGDMLKSVFFSLSHSIARFSYQRNIFIIIIAWPITVGAFFGVHLHRIAYQLFTILFILFRVLLFYFSLFSFLFVRFSLERKSCHCVLIKGCLVFETILFAFFLLSWQETGRVYVIHVRAVLWNAAHNENNK